MAARHRRRGFILVAVLGAIVVAVALGMVAVQAARVSLRAAANRGAFLRARWNAEDCIQRARATLAENEPALGTSWSMLDTLIAAAPLLRDARRCSISLEAAGDRLDVNVADATTLQRVLAGLEFTPPQADSLVDALMDWRDDDDQARPRGAESSWYRARGLLAVRNGALKSRSELWHIRGFADSNRFARSLGVEKGRVSLSHTPATILAALPGFSPELIEHVMKRRLHRTVTSDLNELAMSLPAVARATLVQSIPVLQPLIAAEPDAWILTARGTVPESRVVAVVEVRLAPGGPGGVVAWRRDRWE